jgi:hypothetical protein
MSSSELVVTGVHLALLDPVADLTSLISGRSGDRTYMYILRVLTARQRNLTDYAVVECSVDESVG